nr:MAG TPA: hypothetical protein [Caudoviricetes sp.]
MKTNRLSAWETLLMIVAVALLGYFLTSCSPKVRVVPVERTRVEWRDRLRLDSIYVHDSIYLTEKQAGDTIYKVKEVYRWRDRWRVDTINTGRVDSVRITEVVEVPEKLTAWQVWRLKAFAPLLSIALALGALVSRRLWLPLLRGL